MIEIYPPIEEISTNNTTFTALLNEKTKNRRRSKKLSDKKDEKNIKIYMSPKPQPRNSPDIYNCYGDNSKRPRRGRRA